MSISFNDTIVLILIGGLGFIVIGSWVRFKHRERDLFIKEMDFEEQKKKTELNNLSDDELVDRVAKNLNGTTTDGSEKK